MEPFYSKENLSGWSKPHAEKVAEALKWLTCESLAPRCVLISQEFLLGSGDVDAAVGHVDGVGNVDGGFDDDCVHDVYGGVVVVIFMAGLVILCAVLLVMVLIMMVFVMFMVVLLMLVVVGNGNYMIERAMK